MSQYTDAQIIIPTYLAKFARYSYRANMDKEGRIRIKAHYLFVMKKAAKARRERIKKWTRLDVTIQGTTDQHKQTFVRYVARDFAQFICHTCWAYVMAGKSARSAICEILDTLDIAEEEFTFEAAKKIWMRSDLRSQLRENATHEHDRQLRRC